MSEVVAEFARDDQVGKKAQSTSGSCRLLGQ